MNLQILKDVSSIIGMIGGILGIFVFIDNYILKFKPKFNISNRLFFRYKTKDEPPITNGRSLESIILKIEAINKRNKIGKIDDFAIRVYDSRATFPSAYMLYAEYVLKELPIKTSGLDGAEIVSFSPISILGKSNSNFVIEFKPEKYTVITLKPEGSLKLDLLYYRTEKGWQSVGTFTPYYFRGHKDNEDPNGAIEYSLLDTAVIRKDASNSLKTPEVGIYRGISGKYLSYYAMKPVYLAKRIAAYPVKVFELASAIIQLTLRLFYSHCLVFPLLRIKSKKLPSISFRPARAHLIEDTNLSLKTCRAHIERLSEDINFKADKKAQISITDDSDGFKIRRGRLEVKFYKSGDGHIRANDTGGYPQMFTFSMELVEYPFGIRLWSVNKKVMSVKSACIHVMDSFILLAY